MTACARRIATAIAATSSPLAASAGLLAGSAEGAEASTLWNLLGIVAPLALWGVPLAYVVFTVASVLPRHPGAQGELEPPRDATAVDRLTLSGDVRDGW